MKLFFSLVFLFFSSVSFQAQAQGFIPGLNTEYDFNQFDWQAFSAKENVTNLMEMYLNIPIWFEIFRLNVWTPACARVTNTEKLNLDWYSVEIYKFFLNRKSEKNL